MEILLLFGILLRRKWVILGTFAAFFLAVVLVTYLVTPVYQVSSKLLIESTNSSLTSLMSSLGMGSQSMMMSSSSDDTYDTDIAMATIRPLLHQLIDTLELKDRNGDKIKPEKLTKWSLRNQLQPQPYLEVDQYEDADMLEITAESTDSQQATDMANKLAEFYIASTLERTRAEFKAARQFIDQHIEKVRDEYYEELHSQMELKTRTQTVNLDLETQNLLTRITSLKTSHEDNEASISDFQNKLKKSKDEIKNVERMRKDSQENRASDFITSVKNRMNTLMVDIAGKGVDYKSSHPEYKSLEKEIDEAKKLIEKEAKVIFDKEKLSVDPVYDMLYTGIMENTLSLEAALAKREVLKKFIAAYQTELMSIPVKYMENAKIDLVLSVKKEMYQKLLEYQINVGIAESMTLSNYKLVEPAEVEEKPDYPNKLLNFVVGGFLGLFWGLTMGLLVEYTDNKVKAPEDFKRFRQLIVLGTVQRSIELARKKLISHFVPTSPLVESFRKIKNNIRFASAAGRHVQTIMVTSSLESEGKSSTAANLALMFASEGRKVLVMDLDFRRPNIHNIFSIPNQLGASNVLLENLAVEQVIIPSGVENVEVMPCGPIPADPSRLIESPELQRLVETMKARYDMVILDTPPILVVNDGVVVGGFVDGIVFVVEAGRISYNLLEQVTETITNTGLPVLGVVLNKFRHHRKRHGYYYSSYYYSQQKR